MFNNREKETHVKRPLGVTVFAWLLITSSFIIGVLMAFVMVAMVFGIVATAELNMLSMIITLIVAVVQIILGVYMLKGMNSARIFYFCQTPVLCIFGFFYGRISVEFIIGINWYIFWVIYLNRSYVLTYFKSKQRYNTDRMCILFFSRAYSFLILAALLCTLSVKLFHALRYNLMSDYLSWVLSDVSFLLMAEVILALICFRWRRKWIFRIATFIAAVLCTWSVINAGWLIRTGTQILPRVLLPLFRSPLNAFGMIGVNLVKMPKAASILLGPSAIALIFLFYVLSRPRLPVYKRQRFFVRVLICLVLVLAAVITRPFLMHKRSPQAASVGMQFNAQLKAVMSLLIREYSTLPNPEREIPLRDQITVEHNGQALRNNLVIVVLEGVQYKYTSLSGDSNNLTPYLSGLAAEGVEFTNTHTSLTHTTKALFALLTGRYPSASQDIAEAVPSVKPYASIATVLSDELGYRTAFYQSAKGDFESRPGLVYNLGFQEFWSRDDLGDPNCYIGYLGSDEFAMLKPISDWIKSDRRPFFITVLCSVTHDPYEVPSWFGTPDKEPIGRYRQAINYTDKFLAALDVELTKLNLADKTVLCVIGDHGEAFGEHGQLGHERIFFEEALRVPFCIRAPFLIERSTKVQGPVGSIDLTPTLLTLLGFGTEKASFDGINVLGHIETDRKIYFSGWMQEGPAGYIKQSHKYVYDPVQKTTFIYDLDLDPHEQTRLDITKEKAKEVADEIIEWRKKTIFQINQGQNG
jgi:arylsulfatase A-like enzyme